jgi:hypothetical protein
VGAIGWSWRRRYSRLQQTMMSSKEQCQGLPCKLFEVARIRQVTKQERLFQISHRTAQAINEVC